MSKRILLLSSVSPNFSAGLVTDYAMALKKAGFLVDILTKYKVDGYEENIISAYDTKNPTVKANLCIKTGFIRKSLQLLRARIISTLFSKQLHTGAVFPYTTLEEFDYPVPSSNYLNKLDKNYVAVFVLYMQYMFTEKSLKDIYEKLHVPIYAFTIDMYLMTGGCYYPGACTNFKIGCKNCLFVKKKFQNSLKQHYEDKKAIYKSIDLKLFGNTWTELFFKQSLATKDLSFYRRPIIVNEDIFSVKDKLDSRKRFEISVSKRFVILAGVANNTPRKGFKYLIKAVNSFYNLLPEKCRNEVILVLIGRGTDELAKKFKVDSLETGFLDMESLSLAYSSADVFVSPSIDDAGPSMVNQALMCGTPVVSFNIGTALDVVRDSETGYAVAPKDYSEMAHSLLKLFYLSPEQSLKMREQCRLLSFNNSSIESISNFFNSFF